MNAVIQHVDQYFENPTLSVGDTVSVNVIDTNRFSINSSTGVHLI